MLVFCVVDERFHVSRVSGRYTEHMLSWLGRWRWWILVTAFAVATAAAGLFAVELDSKRRDEAFDAIQIGMQKDEVDRLVAYARAKETWSELLLLEETTPSSPEYTYYQRGREWAYIQWSKEGAVKGVWRGTDPPSWEAWFNRVRAAIGL
jgi:hypothetical protein